MGQKIWGPYVKNVHIEFSVVYASGSVKEAERMPERGKGPLFRYLSDNDLYAVIENCWSLPWISIAII